MLKYNQEVLSYLNSYIEPTQKYLTIFIINTKWEKKEKTIFELFDFVQTNMPLSKGGSLSEQEYFDLFAFWLSFNNYTEGDSPFNAEVLDRESTY